MPYTGEMRLRYKGPSNLCVQYIRPARVLIEQVMATHAVGKNVKSASRKVYFTEQNWVEVKVYADRSPIVTIHVVEETKETKEYKPKVHVVKEINFCNRKYFFITRNEDKSQKDLLVIKKYVQTDNLENPATGVTQEQFANEEAIEYVTQQNKPAWITENSYITTPLYSAVLVLQAAAIQLEDGWLVLDVPVKESVCTDFDEEQRLPDMPAITELKEATFCKRTFFPSKNITTQAGLAITYRQCREIELLSPQGDIFRIEFDEYKTDEECGI